MYFVHIVIYRFPQFSFTLIGGTVHMVQCLTMAMLSWPHGIDRFCKHYKVTRKSVRMACIGVGTTWTNRKEIVYTGPEYVTMQRSKAAHKPRFMKCSIGVATAVMFDTTASQLVASDLAASDLAASDLAASDLAASDLAASDLAASDLAASLWTDIVSEDTVAASIWTDMVSDEALVLPDTNALSFQDSATSHRDHQCVVLHMW
jgi:hypothetical protein